MEATISLVTSTGARAPVTSTAPTRRSARRSTWLMLKLLDTSVMTRPWKRSSTARRRSRLMSRIETSAPRPSAMRAALTPDGARAQDHDVAGRHAGDAGQQDAAAAVGLGPGRTRPPAPTSRPATSLIGASRGSAAVGALHRLVGDGDDARGLQRARQLGRRRQVQVGEEDLARRASADTPRRSGSFTLRISSAWLQTSSTGASVAPSRVYSSSRMLLPSAGAALDDHAVPALDQGAGAGRRQRHALLART